MKRKLITTLLAISVVATLALTGCDEDNTVSIEVQTSNIQAETNSVANAKVALSGGSTTSNSDSVQSDSADSVEENSVHVESNAEPATEAVTEAQTEAQTEAVAQAPTEAPTETVTQAPTEAPTETVTEAQTEAPTQTASASTASTSTSSNVSASNGFDKTMAKQIWEYVNAERTANGRSALAWDESIYNYACQRAQEIVTDFSHDKNAHSGYGENILARPESMTSSAYDLHMQWYNSSGHHTNYMDSKYASGACAVYYYNGTYYAVQNFMVPGTRYTASNGVSVIITPDGGISYNTYDTATQQAIAEATASIKASSNSATNSELISDGYTMWTASNGVTIYYKHSGNSCSVKSSNPPSEEAFNTAVAEHRSLMHSN